MTKMTVAMGGAYFDTGYTVSKIRQLAYVGRLDGFGEAWPAGSRIIFIRRSEQRFTRNDIDIDARLLVTEIRAGSRPLRIALLGYTILVRRKL
jgi:hypothetical protein